MDSEPTPPRPGSSLPVVRRTEPSPPGSGPAPAPPPGSPPRPQWRRITRTRRGAAGLGIAAAALLLWPFADWSWWPWAAGVGALVLLRLLRLDGLLRGWAPHVAGLVVVAGLMVGTGPWAWALAASIGLLFAGMLQLPAWRLAAAGAVLCVVTGAGYAVSSYESAEVQRRIDEQRSEQSFSLLGERNPERVLPALLEGIGQGDTEAVCGLLDEPAREQFVRAAGAPDCPAAVVTFRATLGPSPQIRDLDAGTTPLAGAPGAVGAGDGAGVGGAAGPSGAPDAGGTAGGGGAAGTSAWVTDGCRTAWARDGLGGLALGTLEIRRSEPPGRTYFIAGFRPC